MADGEKKTGRQKYKNLNISRRKTASYKEINIFLSFWRAIIWWKIKIWQKIVDTSFKGHFCDKTIFCYKVAFDV